MLLGCLTSSRERVKNCCRPYANEGGEGGREGGSLKK